MVGHVARVGVQSSLILSENIPFTARQIAAFWTDENVKPKSIAALPSLCLHSGVPSLLIREIRLRPLPTTDVGGSCHMSYHC